MTITNFFNKIANYFNNSLDVENKLLVVCEEFRKGNTEKAFKKFSQLPSETQKKIFNYQWKVLGKPASEANSPIVAHEQFGKLAFFNLENRSCTTLKKIEAIEKYLIHQIKQVLLSIQTDLDHCDDTKVYSKFSQVCALSKHIELIKNLENDIYYIMWKVLGKPDQPRIGESYFQEPIGVLPCNGYSDEYFAKVRPLWQKYGNKAVAISKSIRYLSNFSFLKNESKKDELYVNVIKERHIVIKGKKEFREQVFKDVGILLTIERGRELFSRIEDQNRKITIEYGKDRMHTIILPQNKRSRIYIRLQNENDAADSQFVTWSPHKAQYEVIETSTFSTCIALAHEFCHVINYFDHSNYELLEPHSALYPHLEEEAVITGNGKNGEYIKLNENAFRKELGLPSRISHQAFSKSDRASSMHYACGLGALESIQVLLDQGQKVDSLDLNGLTPLQYVLNSRFPSQDPEKFKKIMDILIANGANLDKESVINFIKSRADRINKEYVIDITEYILDVAVRLGVIDKTVLEKLSKKIKKSEYV